MISPLSCYVSVAESTRPRPTQPPHTSAMAPVSLSPRGCVIHNHTPPLTQQPVCGWVRAIAHTHTHTLSLQCKHGRACQRTHSHTRTPSLPVYGWARTPIHIRVSRYAPANGAYLYTSHNYCVAVRPGYWCIRPRLLHSLPPLRHTRPPLLWVRPEPMTDEGGKLQHRTQTNGK